LDHLLTAHLSRLAGKVLIILVFLLLRFLLMKLGAFLLRFLRLIIAQARRGLRWIFVGQEGGLVQKVSFGLLEILFVLIWVIHLLNILFDLMWVVHLLKILFDLSFVCLRLMQLFIIIRFLIRQNYG